MCCDWNFGTKHMYSICFADPDLIRAGKIDVSELTKLADELNAGMTKEEV